MMTRPFPEHAAFRPSLLSVTADAISQVEVRRAGAVLNPVPEEQLEQLDREFKALAKDDVTAERLEQLALKYGMLQGKWIGFIRELTVDAQWQTLAQALLDDKLPSHILAVKVNVSFHY